jgi:hypothetical protein
MCFRSAGRGPLWRFDTNPRVIEKCRDVVSRCAKRDKRVKISLAQRVVYFTCDLSLCDGVTVISGFKTGTT